MTCKLNKYFGFFRKYLSIYDLLNILTFYRKHISGSPQYAYATLLLALAAVFIPLTLSVVIVIIRRHSNKIIICLGAKYYRPSYNNQSW